MPKPTPLLTPLTLDELTIKRDDLLDILENIERQLGNPKVTFDRREAKYHQWRHRLVAEKHRVLSELRVVKRQIDKLKGTNK